MARSESNEIFGQAMERLGLFEPSEIIMAKDLKESSFEKLLERLKKAGSHALLVKYRGAKGDAVLLSSEFFESLAETLKEYHDRLTALEEELEERVIIAELAGREVTDQTNWKSESDFLEAVNSHRPDGEK